MKIIIKKIIVPGPSIAVSRPRSLENLKTRSKTTLTIKDLPRITMGKLVRLYEAIGNVKRIMSGIPHAMKISIEKPDKSNLSAHPFMKAFMDDMDEKIKVNIHDLPDLSDRELGQLHSAIGKLKAVIENL